MLHKMEHFYICYQIWLKRKNLFQTFDHIDPSKIKQDIKEMEELMDESFEAANKIKTAPLY